MDQVPYPFNAFGMMDPIINPQKPTIPKIPKKDDLDVQRAALEARLQQNRRAGRRSTILTGGQGDTSQIVAQRKTLLGS